MARRRYRPGGTAQTMIAASAARTTTGTGSAVQVNERHQVAKLDVTAASGTTPSLTVTIEESPNGSTGWVTRASFAARSTTGSQVIPLPRAGPWVRAAWSVSGGTPSFTFAVQLASDATALQ